MTTTHRRFTVLTIAGAALAAVGYVQWSQSGPARADAGNSIMVLKPYRLHGTWVFDDPSVGLRQEPFVAGIPEMIDELVKEMPDAKNGFRLLFSAHEFPGVQKTLTWTRAGNGGNYYRLDAPPMEGWLCPALFKYYRQAPKQLFVKAEPLTR